MLSAKNARRILPAVRLFRYSKAVPTISQLFEPNQGDRVKELKSARPADSLDRQLEAFQKLKNFKNKKQQIGQMIRRSIQADSFIHDIELILDKCLENTESYVLLLELATEDSLIQREIPYTFHKRVIDGLLSRPSTIPASHWCAIFRFIRKNFKSKKLYLDLCDVLRDKEAELLELRDNAAAIYALSVLCPERMLQKIDTLDFGNFGEEEFWQMLSGVVFGAVKGPQPDVIRLILSKDFEKSIHDVQYFVDNIDVYLEVYTRLDLEAIRKNDNELYRALLRVNELVRQLTKTTLSFGTLREIKQFLQKLDNYHAYFLELDQHIIEDLFNGLNARKVLETTNSNFDRFLFLLTYLHFGLKFRLLTNLHTHLHCLESILSQYALAEDFAQRIEDRQFHLLAKFLFNMNYPYIMTSKEKASNPMKRINELSAAIIDFKIPKLVAKRNMKPTLAIKTALFLKKNYETYAQENPRLADTFLINFKRMEFLLAECLVHWKYDSQTAVYLKMILSFLNNNYIGSVKFKALLKLAIENGDYQKRRALFAEYMRVKKAKMSLEHKVKATKRRHDHGVEGDNE